MDDRKKENKWLIEAHPILILSDVPEFKYEHTALDLVPIGWRQLVLELCEKLEGWATSVGVNAREMRFSQLTIFKGQLVAEVDTDKFDDGCRELIESYCERSLLICPACGGATHYLAEVDPKHCYYLCEQCAERARASGAATRPLTEEDVPYYTYYAYNGDTNEEKAITTKPTHHDAQFRSQWGGKTPS